MRRVVIGVAVAAVLAIAALGVSGSTAEAGSCRNEPPWEPPAQVWCYKTHFYPHYPSWGLATFRTCRYYNPNPTPLWCADSVTTYGGA